MTVKKLLLVLLMVVLTVAVFANGRGEDGENRHEEMQTLIESKEKVTLTGELLIANRLLPELKVGPEIYKLKVPRYYMAAVDVSDGTEITVEGVILKVKADVNTRMFKAGESVLVVTKAVINGEEYDLQEFIENCDEEFCGDHRPGRGGNNYRKRSPRGGKFRRGRNSPPDEIFE